MEGKTNLRDANPMPDVLEQPNEPWDWVSLKDLLSEQKTSLSFQLFLLELCLMQ